MSGAVVAVEFVILAVILQLGLVLVHLLRARGAIVVAEDAQKRGVQLRRQVDRRDRALLAQVEELRKREKN